MELTTMEQQLLLAFRNSQDCLFIGIDHHGAQLTVAATLGKTITEQTTVKPGYSWLPTRVFAQDGLGYVALLEFLADTFPGVPRERYRFLSEPSYARPCSYFLLSSGFSREQLLWVDTRKVSQFRKAHRLGAGKSDVDDARTMVALLYHAANTPGAPVHLFEIPELDPATSALADYAADCHRIGKQMLGLQGQIVQLVLLLFPEARRLWCRKVQLPKTTGGTYERLVLALFDTLTPLRVLAAFPGARLIAEAGFESVWAAIGGSGLRKASIQRLVALAQCSGGIDDPRLSRRLGMLIEEYQELERRKERYKSEIVTLLESDPVFASLLALPSLGPQQLATIIGAMGNARRFPSVDAMKRYMNVAPMPMPQSGDVDERGRPVQHFRLPTNSYERVNGQRRLCYQAPGRKDVRCALYLATEQVMRGQAHHPDDPFVRYYQDLKAVHQSKARWLGRVRWKLASKLLETIYYCLKYRRVFDPTQVVFKVQPHVA